MKAEQFTSTLKKGGITCKSLIDDAKESYVWEYHRGEVDSVRYAIAIGEYQNGDTMTTYRRNREVYYNRAPELISFHYFYLSTSDTKSRFVDK